LGVASAMVTRKSDDGPPADKSAARPGSYVKISGSRRRRKGKKQGAGAATASSVSPAMPPDGAKDGDDDALPYGIDDLRPSKAPSANRPSWRPPGPLGMDERRVDAADAEEHPIAPEPDKMAQVALPPAGGPDNHNQSLTEGLPPEQQAEIDEELARQLSEAPPPRALPRDIGAVRQAVQPRDDMRPANLIGDEVPRHSLSSVLGARPSLRPSPVPPPTRFSLMLWVAIAVLVAIIAAAIVVAVRETLHEGEVGSTGVPTHRRALVRRRPVYCRRCSG
jgi:hypothetical protein